MAASPDPGDDRRPRRPLAWRIVRRTLVICGYGVAIVATFVLVSAFNARKMPELSTWHRDAPRGEFTARDLTDTFDLDDYLAIEQRLFEQVDDYYIDADEAKRLPTYTRYIAGGPADPRGFAHDWNRTTELVPEVIRGGALVLHGLSDSPYSLRAVAELLHRQGFYTICLRLPGHGTVPAAMKSVRWTDWQAAAEVGARRIVERIAPDQPFFIAGYSMGGAVALKMAMDALEDRASRRGPDRLLLFSPAAAVTPFARLTLVDQSLSFIPYFERSAWLNVDPEFDPYKYVSFAERASYEIWKLSRRNLAHWERLVAEGKGAELAPVTAFQSAVDSTVLISGLVELIRTGTAHGNELVVFDVNHAQRLDSFFRQDPALLTSLLRDPAALHVDVAVITNATSASHDVVVRRRLAGEVKVAEAPLGVAWPAGFTSLGHVAIPFPPSDPWYGDGTGTPEDRVSFGSIVVRSERGVLTVSTDTLMRTRYNPFFGYVEQRIVETIERAGVTVARGR